MRKISKFPDGFAALRTSVTAPRADAPGQRPVEPRMRHERLPRGIKRGDGEVQREEDSAKAWERNTALSRARARWASMCTRLRTTGGQVGQPSSAIVLLDAHRHHTLEHADLIRPNSVIARTSGSPFQISFSAISSCSGGMDFSRASAAI